MTSSRVRLMLQHGMERSRSSLWLVPGAAAVLAVVAAKAIPHAEDVLGRHDGTAWYLFAGQASSARELLSTIATAMMTFTGLVFSITILVLQLASQQFSPRVLRTFLEDRATQVAMATFIGTFVYAMALLPEVHSADAYGGERVPALSVFLSFVLVMVSVGVFVRYIDAMAHSVRAVHVLLRVADDGSRSIERLYPDQIGGDEVAPSRLPEPGTARVVRSDPSRGGVVSAVDAEALYRMAEATGAVVELLPRLGDFVPRGSPLYRVWDGPAELEESELRACVVLSDERTPHQDPAFAFRQLVDIAERALSPGVNDPTTAVQAIDRIQDLLTALSSRAFPPEERSDAEGKLRLVLHRPTWDDLVHLAFDEIREYGRASLQVVRRLRQALEALRAECSPERQRVLDEELSALATCLESFHGHDRRRAAMASAQG